MIILQILAVGVLAIVALYILAGAVGFFLLTVDSISDGRNRMPGDELRRIYFTDAWLETVATLVLLGAVAGLIISIIRIAGEAW